MVKSINSKVELVQNATSHLGISTYGKIMIGNNGFEFYNDKNVKDFIQIPWNEVDQVIVSVIFKGKWIPRYSLKTKSDGNYIFSSRDPKAALRAIREHVPADHIVKSLSFLQVVSRGIKSIFHKKK